MNTAINTCGSIMDVYSWPYGNANEVKTADGTWKFTCQHGSAECAGNMYEACGIEHNNKTNTDGTPVWWKYFYCLEKSGNAGSATVAQNCANNNGLDWSVISTCAGSDPTVGSSTDGNPLMHNIALWTNALNPPHQWTPWVILDGTPLTQAQLDLPLLNLVCNEYTAKTKQTAKCCGGLTSNLISKRDEGFPVLD